MNQKLKLSKRLSDILAEASKRNIMFFADDNGHSHHKVSHFTKDGSIISRKFLNSVVTGVDFLSQDGIPQNAYSVNGNNYTWNPRTSRAIPIVTNTYQTAEHNFALVAHSIMSATDYDFGAKIVLGTSLPCGQYFIGRGKNDPLITHIGSSLTSSEIVNLTNNAKLNICKNIIFMEGVAAMFDYLLTDEGNRSESAESHPVPESYLILDIGGGTVNLIVIDAGTKLSVNTERSSSIQRGVNNIKDEVRRVIINKAEHDSRLSCFLSGIMDNDLLQRVIQKGVIDLGDGNPIDVSEEILRVKKTFLDGVIHEAVTKLGILTLFNKVFITGGGGQLLSDLISEKFHEAIFLDEFATSKGILKQMVILHGEKILKEIG